MDIFQSIITKVAILLLIYLILSRALSNVRRRTRGIIIFFVGLFLGGIFLFAYFIDSQNPNNVIPEHEYFTYIIINLTFSIVFFIFALARFRKNEFTRHNYFKDNDYSPTSKVHYKKFLYLVFEYKNEYLLRKHKETYSGMNLALKKGEFHDVEIGSLLKQYNAINSKVTAYGQYTNTKSKEIYFAYLINLDKDISIKKYEFIYYSKIRFLEMNDFDKQIIYRVLIKEKIDLEQ